MFWSVFFRIQTEYENTHQKEPSGINLSENPPGKKAPQKKCSLGKIPLVKMLLMKTSHRKIIPPWITAVSSITVSSSSSWYKWMLPAASCPAVAREVSVAYRQWSLDKSKILCKYPWINAATVIGLAPL